MNRWILIQSGFIGLFYLPWSERPRITDSDPHHPKGTHPFTGNRTNSSDRERSGRIGKGPAEKLSAGISISLGWPVVSRPTKKKKWRTTWETILLCVWSLLVKFSIYYGPERHANFNNATEHEDPAALAIFLGIFLGTGRVFRWVLQRTTRLNAQTVELPRVRCCRGKMVDLQAWKVTRSKNFTKKHMEIAPFYIDRSKVLAILS